MIKERENELAESDSRSAIDCIQGRFPNDDLDLHHDNKNENSSSDVTMTPVAEDDVENNNSCDNENTGKTELSLEEEVSLVPLLSLLIIFYYYPSNNLTLRKIAI